MAIYLKNNKMKQNNKLFTLDKLVEISNNDAIFISKMIEIFSDQINLVLPQIKSFETNNELALLKENIHKIRPSIESMGITSIIDDLVFIEKYIIEKGLSIDVKKKLINVYDILDTVLDQLKEYKH